MMRQVLSLGLVIFMLFSTGSVQAAGFMDSLEQDVGAGAHPDILAQFGGEYQHPVITPYVQGIGQKVASYSDRTDIDYKFYILNSDKVNAMAVPGGYVYITMGMLKRLHNEAQLAAVLGHELAHVSKKHGMGQIKKALGFQLLLIGAMSAFGGSKKSKRTAQIVGIAGSVGIGLAMSGYSRKDEYEADRLGTVYMFRAGYDPGGAVQMLEILKEEEKREPSKFEEFFMSHPKTSDRLNDAQNTVAQLKTFTEQYNNVKGNYYPDNYYENVGKYM